jgi:hypothetical protein
VVVASGQPYRALLNLIGATHEAFHLVARTINNPTSLYPGQDFPDTAWFGLYRPSSTGLGQADKFSWDGYPAGRVLSNRPYSAPADAQKWMTVSSVQTGGLPQSQCDFIRADPKGYLIQAVY